ncbi:MAG: protein kinase [Solobacterium sp.]|nr:protein kinase [Solobacterium sp.]
MAQILNRTYEILEFVGKGGMSTVFKARHIRLDTIVAIKSVRKDQAVDLAAEVHILTKLNHPNLVRVIDIFEDEKLLYIVMDYVEGEDLQHVINRLKVIPEETVKEWFITLADLLRYLHTRKPPIIYRDMKPANVILQPDGTLKLIDFGIAREYKAQATGDTTYIGTNGFAAPEQFGLAQSDGRTDIYSLGMTMFYLATGKSPLQPPYGYTPARKLNPAVSPGMEAILEKCIRDNPEDRYQSADELLKDLNEGATYPLHPTHAFPSASLAAVPSGSTDTQQAVPQAAQPAPEKKRFNPALIIGILCAAAALIAGIFFILPKGTSPAPAPEEEEEVVIDESITAENGVLKVAVSGITPPFSSSFDDGQEQLGYDIMIAQKIAERLGYGLEIVTEDFGNEREQLESGAADLVMQGASQGMYTGVMEESEPYFRHGICFVFPQGTNFDTTELADYVKGMDALVSVKRDYLSDFAESLGMTAAGTVGESTDELNEAVRKVKDGDYDCAVFSTEDLYNIYYNDIVSILIIIKQEDLSYYGYKLPENTGSVNPDNLVINARKGNTQLIRLVNQVLSGISPNDRQDIMLDAMKDIVLKQTGS